MHKYQQAGDSSCQSPFCSSVADFFDFGMIDNNVICIISQRLNITQSHVHSVFQQLTLLMNVTSPRELKIVSYLLLDWLFYKEVFRHNTFKSAFG